PPARGGPLAGPAGHPAGADEGTAQPRCRAGTAHGAARATKTSDAAVPGGLATPYGTRAADAVRPGAGLYQAFAVRAATVDAGEATVTAGGVTTTHAFDGTDCS